MFRDSTLRKHGSISAEFNVGAFSSHFIVIFAYMFSYVGIRKYYRDTEHRYSLPAHSFSVQQVYVRLLHNISNNVCQYNGWKMFIYEPINIPNLF